jgi:hypothetical protein
VGELAPISGLTYDGTSIQTSPIGIHVEITKGLNESATVRGEDDVVASMTGRVSYPRIADVLPIEGSGVLLGIGDDVSEQMESYRTAMAALRALLAGGKLTPKVLSGTLEDGSTATINARVVDYQVTEKVASLAAELKIAWESVDPDWVITGL